jgi:hypothetical protein
MLIEPPKRAPLTTVQIGYPDDTSELPPRTSLLGLPAELRLLIYSFLFPRESTPARLRRFQEDKHLGADNIHVLLVCRQLYHECAPLLRRTLLIVPTRRRLGDTESVFPLGACRAGSVGPEVLSQLRIRDVLIREYVDTLGEWRVQPEWDAAWSNGLPALYKSDAEKPLELHVDTIYLTLCLCRGSLWGLADGRSPAWNNTFGMDMQWANSLCAAIRRCVEGVRSVKRVVVVVCGLRGGKGYTEESAKGVVDGLKGKLKHLERGLVPMENESRWWVTERLEYVDKDAHVDGRKREEGEVTKWRVTFKTWRKLGELEENSVEVEFYDSWTECRKNCALA